MVSISRLYDLLPFLFAGCLDGCRGFSHSCHLFNPTNTECQLCPLALTERWQFSGEQKAHMLCPVGKMLHNIFTTVTHTESGTAVTPGKETSGRCCGSGLNSWGFRGEGFPKAGMLIWTGEEGEGCVLNEWVGVKMTLNHSWRDLGEPSFLLEETVLHMIFRFRWVLFNLLSRSLCHVCWTTTPLVTKIARLCSQFWSVFTIFNWFPWK